MFVHKSDLNNKKDCVVLAILIMQFSNEWREIKSNVFVCVYSLMQPLLPCVNFSRSLGWGNCVCFFPSLLHPCDTVRARAPAAAFVLSLLPSMANVDFCPFFPFTRTEFALKETMSTGGGEDDIPQGERKTVTDFCYLLDKSKQLFNGLRSVGFRCFGARMYT